MQVILDSSFARPGLAPIWGGKKREFRDWTRFIVMNHYFDTNCTVLIRSGIMIMIYSNDVH